MSQRQTKRLSLCLPPLSPFSIFPLPGQCCSSLCSNFFFPNSCVPNIPPPHLPTLRILPPPSYWICLSFSFTFLFLWSLSILLSLLYFSLSLYFTFFCPCLLFSLQFFLPLYSFLLHSFNSLTHFIQRETRLRVCSLSPNTTVILLLFVINWRYIQANLLQLWSNFRRVILLGLGWFGIIVF